MARNQTSSEQQINKLSASESKSELLHLLSLYKPYKWQASIAIFIMLVSSSASLLFPKLTGNLIDSVTSGKSLGSMWNIGFILFTLFLVQAIVQYFSSVTLSTATENALKSLREKVFNQIIELPLSYFSENRVGDILSRVTTDVTQVQETFSFTLIQLLRQSIFLVGGVAIIVATSWRLTIPVLSVLPLLIFIALTFGKKLRRLSTQAQEKSGAATTIVEEVLQGIESVKSFVNESHETKRYSNALTEYVTLSIKSAKFRSVFISFILFAMFGGIAGVLTYGGMLLQSKEISLGDLTSFLMYAMFVAGALGSFAELFGQIQKTLGASVRIREILNQQTETDAGLVPKEKLVSVQFDNVSFSYPSRKDVQVLDNISFQIEPGSRVAFVGESGAGKSTTASLIQQFYEPVSGSISFNKQNSSQLSKREIRKNIGVVPQDVLLFGGTIEDNVRYGKLDATADEIIQALTLANALEFVNSFPDGIKTLVGERGIKLSGGQRQRIAIARAILKNPPILILDEATSSLDSQTEKLIQDALERLMVGRTTIIIAHRLSTIRKCDSIYVFKNGSIVERGSHEELLAKTDSTYATLVRLQYS